MRGTRFAIPIVVTFLLALGPIPSGAAVDPTRALLVQAESAGIAGNYRGADSLARLAQQRLRAASPRSAADRLDLVDGIVAWARPNANEACDTIAAWARWAADRHDRDHRGAAREQAWRSAGRAYQRAGHLDSAVVCYERAVLSLRSRPGATSEEAARLLASIAMQYLNAERSQEALRLGREAAAEWRRSPDADSIVLATALTAGARARLEQSQMDSARADLATALSLRLRRQGPDHGDLVWVWRHIATLRALTDDLPGAKTAVVEAVRIAVLTRPSGDAELIQVYAQAGSVCGAAGDAVEACRYGRLSLSAALGRYGRLHAVTASCRVALANSLSHLGDLASALEEGREAVDVQRQVLPESSGGRAYGLSTLGNIELEAGRPADAYEHFREAARIREAVLGPDHMLVAYSLGGMAQAAEGIGKYEEAIDLLGRVARTQESRGLQKQLFETWNALGRVQHRMGRDSLALTTLDRSVTIADSIFGMSSAAARTPRLLRLPVLRALGRDQEALDQALALAAAERQGTWDWIAAVSDREGLAAAESRSVALSAALEIASDGKAAPRTTRAIWDELTRSRLLAYQVQASRRFRRGLTPSSAAAYARLDSIRSAYAREFVAARLRTSGETPARLDSLRRSLEDAERRAAEALPHTAPRSIGIDEALRSLEDGDRLLAFARFERVARTVEIAKSETRAFGYVAFLGDRNGRVEAVALEDAALLDERVDRWGALVRRPSHDATGEADLERRTAEAGQSVRRTLWDPVAAGLEGAKRVFIVPDGAAANVDFGALPLPNGSYLAEVGPLLVPLSSERDLLPRRHEGLGMLALGAPDFDAGADGMPGAASARGPGTPTAADTSWIRFDPLPESRAEAVEAAEAWSKNGRVGGAVHVATDSLASERTLRQDASARAMLHVATHGFLLDPGAALEPPGSLRGVAALAPAPGSDRSIAGSVDWSLAGLALAGANRPRPTTGAEDDGVLTGAEIAALDLDRVGCAVLSACRSGASRAGRFESIQGLERAFRLAGVGQVVMSLWPVADEDARAWMRAFYGALLDRGLTVPEAVRAADLERLRALRVRGSEPRPDRWAPFFVRGERP